MRHALLISAGIFVSGCGGAESGRQRPVAPGEWEVTTSLVSSRFPNLSEAELDTVRAQFKAPTVERQCFDRPPPSVGAVGPIAGCTYRRVADAGSTVDRESACVVNGTDGGPTITIRGTASPDNYDYLVTVSDGAEMEVVTREVGRRLGDCRPGG